MGLPRIGAAIALDGEREYRSALSSINTSMATLRSELRLSSAEFEGQANSVEALTRRSEVMTRLYEEQEQRCRTMAGALESATQTYGANSREAQEWQTRLNNATTELTRMDRELSQNNEYLEEARRSTNGTATSIDEYGHAVREAEEGTSTFGDVLKANLTSEAIIGGVKALAGALKSVGESAIETVKETAAYADDILTMSNNTGIATDTLQELKYMQELTDVSLDQVTSSMAKQIKSMDNARKGSKDYVEAYKKLNVEFEDGNGHLRDSETVYWELIDSLGKITDETERDATAMKLFGKSAQDLNSLVKIGSEGVAEFAQEARDMGAVLSEDTLDKLGATDDAFQRIDQSLTIFKRELGISMGPSVTRSIEKVTEKITGMGTELGEAVSEGLELLTDGLIWIIDNADTIISALSGIVGGFIAFKAASAIQFAITKFQLLSSAVTSAGGVIKGLWTLIAANPAMTAAVAIGTLVAVFAKIELGAADASDAVKAVGAESEKAVERSKELIEEVDKLLDPKNNQIKIAEVEIGSYEDLAKQLYDIAESETLSNEQKERMAILVDQLNAKIPELNLMFDKQTGAISKTREETEKYIEQLGNAVIVNAGEAQLQEILEAKIKAQSELTTLMAEEEKIRQEYIKFLETEKPNYNLFNDDLAQWQATDKYLLKQITDNVWQQIQLKNAIKDTETEYENTTKIVLENKAAIDETSNSMSNWGTVTESVAEKVRADLDSITEKYEEVKEAAKESILEQIGLFDQYNEEAKYSKEEILANLQSQIDGMKNWSDNMDRAAELGVDEKILKQFRDMGLDSAGYLEEITKMTDTEIQKMNKLYEEKLTVADTVASEMAEAETNLNDALYRMRIALQNGNLTLPNSLQPQAPSVPQPEYKENNVISNEERERREMQQKLPPINVYVGSKQVASVVESENKAQSNRYNPFTK